MEANMDNELKKAVREFFRILDIEEESENGRSFHPTYIASRRVLDMEKMEKALKQMRELSN